MAGTEKLGFKVGAYSINMDHVVFFEDATDVAGGGKLTLKVHLDNGVVLEILSPDAEHLQQHLASRFDSVVPRSSGPASVGGIRSGPPLLPPHYRG